MKKLLVFVMFVSCSFIYAQNEVFMYNPDGTKEYYYVNDKVKYLQYKNSAMEDGYLAIGAPIEVQYDSIIIQEGIYAAYYDEQSGRYVAVAVDYALKN